MTSYFTKLFIILSLISVCIAGGKLRKIRDEVDKYRRDWIKTEYMYQRLLRFKLPLGESSDIFPVQYLTQPLDHFDPEVQRTYQQRYWVNKDFWKTPDGPVFLYIGGEGGIDESTVMGGEHVDLAKQYGALLVSAEHRFYGGSINKDGLELGQLEYLSSQQALADLASFHSHISETYKLTDRNIWICFGGSYPGALSAWFRIKYPHLVYGAIASSAPVRAQLNFEGYNNVVTHSLGDPVVNGSIQCTSAVKSAFQIVDKMIQNGQYQDLAMDFKACTNLTNKDDQAQFVSSLADIFMGTVQYNNEIPGLNIAAICGKMLTGPGNPYSNLKKLILENLDPMHNCTDSSWKNYIVELKNTSVSRFDGVGDRQWLYQSCAQFGFFQTCDEGTECIFSHLMDIEHNIRMCSEVYGLKAESIIKSTNFTNMYYGSDQPKGTRIVFVNGSIDPWHSLSVLSNLSSSETAVYINGTAHCANMGSSKPSDPPQLIQARKEVAQQIGRWLTEISPKY